MTRSRLLIRFSTLLAAAVAVTGCSEATNGVCTHSYRDPLLLIREAHDAKTGNPISRVAIWNVSLGSSTAPVQGLVDEPAHDVTVVGDSLLCTVTCGFGTTEGAYRFTVGAPGYTPTVVGLEAQYRELHGGCPSYNAGSVEVHVALEPAS